ncbi:MAG: hypothetical protein WEE89_09675 [Gemmatimonadota bacterium]
MDRTELFDSAIAIASGVGAAIVYTVLFVAMNAPVTETLTRLLS